MQGQVFVQYTRIMGLNLNNESMPPEIAGSSASAEEATSRTINVLWVLPGGIQNVKNRVDYRGGEWGYLLHTKTYDPTPCTDADVIEWLTTNQEEGVPGCQFGESGELLTPEFEAQVENAVNNKLYHYVERALTFQDGSDWHDFLDYYGLNSCVFISL